MTGRQRGALKFGGAALFFSIVGLLTLSAASASTVSITVSVLDVVFDGTDIVDAGSPLFGSGDLAESVSVDSMIFQVDGDTVGTLTNPPDDLGVDIYIPSVSAIPDVGGIGVSAPGGTFDLLTSSAVPGYGLELDLGAATVIYAPFGGTVDFVFVGAVASVGAQDLPFSLSIGDPINVTVSTQTSSVSSAGGYLTGFAASGSSEVSGILVPEPSSIALGGLALLLTGMRRRRQL